MLVKKNKNGFREMQSRCRFEDGMKVGRRVALTNADICSEDGDEIGDNEDLNVGPDINSIDGAKCSDNVDVKVHLHFS